jgi:hypothetical protein
MQETGRAGRDGFDSIAALYLIKGMGQVEACMKKMVCAEETFYLTTLKPLYLISSPHLVHAVMYVLVIVATCPSSCATPFIMYCNLRPLGGL